MNPAYATLARLAIDELRRMDEGLVPSDIPLAGEAAGEGPDEERLKRAVLEHALAKGGPGPIVAIGRALPSLSYLPIMRVMLNSRDTDALAGKWMRMERYHHSTNRTRIDTSCPGRWTCTRESRGASPPGPAENLLICGVLTGLLDAFGAANARPCDLPDVAGRWQVEWTAPLMPPPPLSWLPGESLPARVARLIRADPGAAWPLEDVARGLALSSRSLQRRLASEGARYSRLLPATRTAVAAEMLLVSDETLAAIGYACGFADQAHFQRSFFALVGMTPGNFRGVGRASTSGVRAPS